MTKGLVLIFILCLSYKISGQISCNNSQGLAQAKTTFCTQQYDPVCGYSQRNQIIRTFGNDCEACTSSNVSYYYNGACEANDEAADQAAIVPVDVPTFAPVDFVPTPADDAAIAPVDEAVIVSDDEAAIAPVDEAAIAPVDEAAIAPVDEAAIVPVDEAAILPVDEAAIAPVDEATIAPADEAAIIDQGADEATQANGFIQFTNCDTREQTCGDEQSEVCGVFNSDIVRCFQFPCAAKYQNSCQACRDSHVEKFFTGECNILVSTDTPQIRTDITSESFYTHPQTEGPYFDCPTNRPQLCEAQGQSVCGQFKESKNCLTERCDRQYVNECQACNDINVVKYFIGDCSYPPTDDFNYSVVLGMSVLFTFMVAL